jgi:hypothetical protein
VVGVLGAFLDPFFLGIAFRVFAALDEHGSGDPIVGVGGVFSSIQGMTLPSSR